MSRSLSDRQHGVFAESRNGDIAVGDVAIDMLAVDAVAGLLPHDLADRIGIAQLAHDVFALGVGVLVGRVRDLEGETGEAETGVARGGDCSAAATNPATGR